MTHPEPLEAGNGADPREEVPPTQGRLLGVRANRSGFREVTFSPGFNVVLADRTLESTRKDSRNGLGKSTLLEIISFCLGAQARRNQGLLVEPLQGWAFTLDMILDGKAIAATRCVDDPSKVHVEGDISSWPIRPGQDLLCEQVCFKLTEWNDILGFFMFDIPIGGFSRQYAPTYRSLISYFTRRGKDAYSTPFEHYRKQQEADKQANNAFLLGLAWENASSWQELKDKKEAIKGLRKAASTEVMAGVMQGSLGELEASKVRLEQQVREQEVNLKQFTVLPQYRELEEKANRLSREIGASINKIVESRQILQSYETSLAETQEPDINDLLAVYEEAGVLFPERVRHRLEEVEGFHHRLLENRRRFLFTEIESLRRIVETTEAEQRRLLQERAGLMQTLRHHGALDEYTRLQTVHAELLGQLQAVKARIENLRRLEESISSLRIEEETLKRRTRNELDDREKQREQAISLFNANAQALYDAPANLIIDLGPSGFRFDVEILRSASQGVGNMKILCYDLMLAQLWSAKPKSPGFVIHDSTLFDGVDERQIAHALELAARKSQECGFQYICALNSDMVPSDDFSDGFDLESFVRLRLTDTSPEGSLLGMRY
jgi:uncharacterized protein YydD (DUF2326 family)